MRTTDDLIARPSRAEERLNSWKEVAAYLRSSVRTVQRWEKEEGLPVHRQQHAKLGSVYAFKSELEAWRDHRSDRSDDAASWTQPASGDATVDWKTQLEVVRAKLADVPVLDPAAFSTAVDAAPTVGREREQAQLRASFDAVVRGKRMLLCLVGEPGIGKTTLLRGFLASLVAGGTSVAIARGHCSERLAGNEAYLPILEALESLLRLPDGDLIGLLMRLVAPTWYVQIAPLWAGTDPAFARVVEDARVASRERLKRELAVFFEELSASRPLVVLLDDLHWADESTIELMAYLAKNAEKARFLAVAAYRGSDLLLSGHAFLDVKRDLQARGLCREVAVDLLSQEATASYLDLAFPGHSFPKTLAAVLHARTDGNPLFLVDLLAHMQRTGVIARDGEHWRLARDLEAVEGEFPESVRSMVDRKLDQLDDEARRLLTAAAMQGAEFDSAVVADADDANAARVEERLCELDRVYSFVRQLRESEMPDGTLSLRFAFVHVLYQNALLDALTPSGRAALARRVAESLVSRYRGEQALVAADLAYLFETARDFARASDFFLAAAENALQVYAQAEAIALADRAIRNAEQLDPPECLPRKQAAAFLRVRTFVNQARHEDAIGACTYAEEVAREAGDQDAVVEAICGQANSYFYLKHLDESDRQGERAMAVARGSGSESAIASAEAALARVHMSRGNLVEASTRFERAIPVLKRAETTLPAIDAVGFRILVHAWRLEYEQVESESRWWLAEAKRHGLQPCQLSFYRGMALGNAGRLSEAMRALAEGIHSAELHGDIYHVCRLPNTLGWVYRLAGDDETALSLDLQSRELAIELGFEEAEANALVNLARDHRVLGQYDRSFECLERAEQIFRDDVWFRWRYNIRLQLEKAELWRARGDLAVAASCAAAAYELAERVLARKHMAAARKIKGDIAADEERMTTSRDEYVAALAVLRDHPCPALEREINAALAEVVERIHDRSGAAAARARAGALAAALAGSIDDDRLRRKFEAAVERRSTGRS